MNWCWSCKQVHPICISSSIQQNLKFREILSFNSIHSDLIRYKKWKIYYNISPKWLPEELQPFLHQQPPVAKFCHFLPHIVIRCLQFSCFLFLPCIHHLQLFHLQDLWKDQYLHSWELLMLLPRRSNSRRNTLHNTNVK